MLLYLEKPAFEFKQQETFVAFRFKGLFKIFGENTELISLGVRWEHITLESVNYEATTSKAH